MKQFFSATIALAVVSCSSQQESETILQEDFEKYKVGIINNLGDILRTPDSQFQNLENFTYSPKYVFLEEGSQLRMHYIDEGPTDGKIILLMHGNPSWVYNFRKLIPLLTAQGFRVICPDLIGFGRSDKPVERAAHTYDNHVKWVTKFIEVLNITAINLHCQDWGGLIGLRVAIQNQDKFEKLAVSNTTLPDGTNVTDAFMAWRTSSQTVPFYSIVMENATYVGLNTSEESAYDAPFPSEILKAGPRELPLKVPITPNDTEAIENTSYWQEYSTWNVPVLTIFSEDDAITDGEQEKIIATWLGASGQNHQILSEASHFIREDRPDKIAELLVDFFK